MAQLYGSAYELQKGERPDFHKAIELYEEIIDSYPADEPLVLKAMVSIGDHYVSLWRFESALEWFKRPLEYDVNLLEERLIALREDPQQKSCAASLKQNIDKIRYFQKIAGKRKAFRAYCRIRRMHQRITAAV